MATAAKKILIVEDGEDWRAILVLLIKRLGYETLEATTGLEAISQATTGHPDLILMDLGLPEMSGDEAMARLKMHPSTRDIPVVVQTAYCSGNMTHCAIEAGAKEILHKPIDLNQLHAVLHEYLPAETTKLAAAAS
jgi:CheY-like chemotaxis protein